MGNTVSQVKSSQVSSCEKPSTTESIRRTDEWIDEDHHRTRSPFSWQPLTLCRELTVESLWRQQGLGVSERKTSWWHVETNNEGGCCCRCCCCCGGLLGLRMRRRRTWWWWSIGLDSFDYVWFYYLYLCSDGGFIGGSVSSPLIFPSRPKSQLGFFVLSVYYFLARFLESQSLYYSCV